MSEAVAKIEADNLDQHFVRVRRVTRPDLMDKAPFLCRRLREKYPHKQDRELHGWLATCCDSNEYFFARSDRAYILALSTRDYLDDRPSVREIFALAETTNDKHPKGSDAEKYQDQQNAIARYEAASLYGDLIRWCQAIGADELMVDKFSDVPLGDKGTGERGTLRWIFASQNLKLLRGEEIFVVLDANAKITKVGNG
jgi:hypothetical protein